MNPNQQVQSADIGATANTDLFIVGIVAAESGLRPLADCLATLSEKPQNYAIVINLVRDGKQDVPLAAEFLSARSKWDVFEARDGIILRGHRVYVAPPDTDIVVDSGVIRLSKPEAGRAPSLDQFFQSLAKDRHSRAIAVVLSGPGSDGVQGVLDIKRAGGYVIVQELHTASAGELPTAAVRTGACDVVVPVEDICAEITAYVNNYELVKNFESSSFNVESIFGMMTRKTGTDFSKYKPTTVLRRIEKRLEALHLENIDLYYRYIKQNPQELDILFRTVLIGVTEFFRDREAFDALRPYLAKIVQSKHYREPIRIWCVSCATGEEAYTIAILFSEILGEDIDRYQVQIFATDIDEQALNVGRRGVYAASAVEHLPQELIDKYFAKVEQGYEVIKSIRQMILFSRHDITNDPPFVRLDLISCRNLLIYFNNDLQHETLSIFHYALNKDGYLFLGKSESVGTAANLFSKASGSNKIFQRVDGFSSSPIRFSHFRGRSRETGTSAPQQLQPQRSLAEIVKETLYATFDHPFAVVNENLEILEVKGSLRLYTEISSGAASANLLKMVNPEINLELRALFARVRKTGVGAGSHVLRFTLFEKEHYVRLHIKPLLHTTNNREHFIVIFEEVDIKPWLMIHSPGVDSRDAAEPHILELTHELASAREHLQTLSEELETSSEELQALNEELQSANEELKSSNEELETSNEELQSANEELQTTNAELRLTNEALVEKESQLRDSRERIKESELLYRTLALNYPNGTISIVDRELNVVFMEGRGMEELGVTSATVLGRPVLELFDEESRSDIEHAIGRTLAGEAVSLTAKSGGSYYTVRTIPLRDRRNEISRVMYVTQNITEIKQMELTLRAMNDENKRLLERERLAFVHVENQRAMLHNLFMQAPAMILILRGPEHVVELVNPLVQQFFGVRLLLGRPVAEALPELQSQNILPILDRVFTTGELYNTTEMPVQLSREDNTQPEDYYFDLTFQPITDENNAVDALLVFAFNVTEQVQARKVIEENALRLKMLIESIPHMAWTAQADGSCDYYNRRWYDYTGQTSALARGWGWLAMIHPDNRKQTEEQWRYSVRTGNPYEIEHRIRSASGDYRWHISRALPLRMEEHGKILSWVGTSTDIDEWKLFAGQLEGRIQERTARLTKAIEDLNRSNKELEQFAYIASHDLQEPLRKIRTFGDRLFERSNALLDTTSRDYLDRMQLASSRMQKLIDDLLTYSRVSSRREPFVLSDMNAVISAVVRDMESDIHKKNAVVHIGPIPQLDVRPIQMAQLFRNLIANALKFSKPDELPHVDIAAEVKTGAELDVPAGPDEKYCVLTVSDNGIGFDNEHADRIFVIFQRLHGKNQYEGTGIGLAVCKKIAENHNGFITASGSVNKGAVFTVILPLHQHSDDTPL